VYNLALARALPDSAIRAAVRASDVTESRSARSLLRTTHARDYCEIIINNHDCEAQDLDPSVAAAKRVMGSSEMEGAFRKWSYALAHAHSLKFESDLKKK
jgi:hypothetical protein